MKEERLLSGRQDTDLKNRKERKKMFIQIFTKKERRFVKIITFTKSVEKFGKII